MVKGRRYNIAMYEETRIRISQLKIDWRCKTDEEVILKLLELLDEKFDPLMYEAIELIRKIREGK